MLNILADALLIAARLDAPALPPRHVDAPALPAKKRGWFGFAR